MPQEANGAPRATSRCTLLRCSSSIDPEILQVVQMMKHGLADKICDRRWRALKVYKKCFTHLDAISWLMNHSSDGVSKKSNEKPGITNGGGGRKDDRNFQQIVEADAVALGNRLIDRGYVSHVANAHRFTIGEKRTLFFRFHSDVIDSDKDALHRQREWMAGVQKRTLDLHDEAMSRDVTELKMKVDRLGESIAKVSHVLDEAHGKILVLETTIASIAFALALISYLTAGMLIYHIADVGGAGGLKERHYTLAVSLGAAVLLFCLRRKFDSTLVDHAEVLATLAATNDMEGEGGLLADISDACDTSVIGSVTSVQSSPRRRSVFREMSRSLTRAVLRLPDAIVKSDRGRAHMEEALPTKMREASDLPRPSFWTHRPVLLCVNTPVTPNLSVPMHGDGALPLGIPFHFRSDLFEGTCLVRLRDVPSDNPEGDRSYFLGRKRRFQSIVQGRFLQELPVSEVLTGHEFAKPLRRLPPPWLLRAATSLIRRLAPGAEIVLHDEQPRAMSILAATSQILSVDMPGNEPDITDVDMKEDVSLFGGIFKGGNVSISQRKKHLSDPNRASKYSFDTESIYTFDFYQQILDVGKYSLDLGFTSIDMAKCLNGQPVQVLSKTVDGRYLWSFQIWHEKLLSRKRKGD